VVQDVTREPRIIAEVDYDSAPSMVHEKAIYLLEGRSYFVEKYDHEERRVHVREADVDYYTDAITYTKVRILERFAEEPRANARRNHGEVHVSTQVVGFKKIKFHTHENVGSGELTMPENEMHTTAYWLTIPRERMGELPYGLEDRRDGVVALSYALGQLAALFLMCDRHDLGVAVGDNGQGEARIEKGWRRGPAVTASSEAAPGVGATLPENADDYEPNVFIYDAYPGGIGLSEPLFRLHDRLLAETRALVAACGCADGCPSCVGPAGEVGSRGKEVALAILETVLGS
jgi:DEAD/DEAH box helicase domain-containing protein